MSSNNLAQGSNHSETVLLVSGFYAWAVSDLYSVSKPNKITFPVYCFALATPNNRCNNYEVQLW